MSIGEKTGEGGKDERRGLKYVCKGVGGRERDGAGRRVQMRFGGR